MKELLDKALLHARPHITEGNVATYIPELAFADPTDLGVAIMEEGGNVIGVGDFEKRFTMQSVVKPLILLAALIDNGMERVRSLVGVESTGKPFDSFNYSDLALTGDHINPMINTGAIALCSLIAGDSCQDKLEHLLALARSICNDPTLEVNEKVYRSESMTGHKNRALAYLLKAYGLIEMDAEAIVDLYFRACSITASAKDLAAMGYVFAHHGVDHCGNRLFPASYARYVNAMLSICGMYDASGEFALTVGIPAKSGVAGGIMALVPGGIGIGVYSPALDRKGNSVAGLKVLEYLSAELDLSIF